MAFAVMNLCKSYGGVDVLKGVDLAVQDGEIHVLLGANGAGKSTLIKCLSGAVKPDSGVIVVGDGEYAFLTPRLAQQAGVSVVYQELSLAMSLDVADNVFLGKEIRVGPFVRRQQQRIETKKLLAQLGIALDPDSELSRVGNAALQAIEIIKALAANPKVLILDEPTASLSEREAERLQHHLKQLRGRNIPVLYVTHRLNEVFALADKVTVIRGGQVVLSGEVESFNHDDLVSAIVGKSVTRARARTATGDVAERSPLLSVRNLVASGIGPVSFDVQPGEVLGIFGLVGSGRTELLEALFGAHPIHYGEITFRGKPFRTGGPGWAFASGMALVPSDRLRRSVFQSLPAADNTLLSSLGRLSRSGVRRKGDERRVFQNVMAQLNLQPRRMDLEARRFSGGNQQKLVLGRCLNEVQLCKLLLLDEPTQGVDVGARREIYDAIQSVSSGADRAVIATSSEPGELMQIAARVLVLSGGQVAGIVSNDEINEENLLSLAHRVEHRGELP